MIFELVKDFSAALAAMPAEHPRRRMLGLLEEAIRRDIHFIARHPTTLFQCMWNSCWWYDCPEAAKHYEEPDGCWPTGNNAPPWALPGEKLSERLELWRARKERRTPSFHWLRSRRPPSVHLGTAQKAVLCGHESGVRSVSYSPDGQRIASGSGDKTVRVWDAASGAELAVLRGHEDDVNSVSYSPDGRRIASGSRDRTVRVWDAASGAELAVLRGHEDDVNSVSYSPDARRIVSGSGSPVSDDNTVRVWDAASGAELAVLRGHEGGVNSVSYSPDGWRIVSGSWDNTVRVWDAELGAEIAALRGHSKAVWSVAFSPDGERIASGSGGAWDEASDFDHMDNTVRLWDAELGAEIAVLGGHEQVVTCVAFSPDGHCIASTSGGDFFASSLDNSVRVWDAVSGVEMAVPREHQRSVTSVAFSPDGRRIASGSEDGTVRLWDAGSSAEMAVPRGHQRTVTSVAFSRNGYRIASGSEDQTVRLWDSISGAEIAVLRLRWTVNNMVFSPDGCRIATTSGMTPSEHYEWQRDTTVTVWDVETGAKTAMLRGHKDYVLSVAFSPDGRRIVSGSEDKTVRVWNAASGAELAVLCGHESFVESVSYSPDARRIVSGSEDMTVRVWDAETYQCLEVIRGQGDVAAIAKATTAPHSFRTLLRRPETIIERNADGRPIAWFPVPLDHITAHPTTHTWVGASGNQLYIITLEGGDEP